VKLLVKIGGTLLDVAESRAGLAAQLADIAREHQLVVVHGGGKQMTRYLDERGIASRFVDGLRVSDEAVIETALKIIAGSVNKELVSALLATGLSPLGLSGIDGRLTTAAQLDPQLHFVGRPVQTDGRLLDLLVNSGYLPVVACLASDAQGNIYNVNADQMAVSCALGWRADRLFFLTDVEGVNDGEGRLIAALSPSEIGRLIESGVATAGMRAKLNAAATALDAGVQEIMIASGRQPAICRRLLHGEASATRLYAPTSS
jgi:acetylglutamate kinase